MLWRVQSLTVRAYNSSVGPERTGVWAFEGDRDPAILLRLRVAPKPANGEGVGARSCTLGIHIIAS